MCDFYDWLEMRAKQAQKNVDGFKAYEDHPNPKVTESENELIGQWEKRVAELESCLKLFSEYHGDWGRG